MAHQWRAPDRFKCRTELILTIGGQGADPSWRALVLVLVLVCKIHTLASWRPSSQSHWAGRAAGRPLIGGSRRARDIRHWAWPAHWRPTICALNVAPEFNWARSRNLGPAREAQMCPNAIVYERAWLGGAARRRLVKPISRSFPVAIKRHTRLLDELCAVGQSFYDDKRWRPRGLALATRMQIIWHIGHNKTGRPVCIWPRVICETSGPGQGPHWAWWARAETVGN